MTNTNYFAKLTRQMGVTIACISIGLCLIMLAGCSNQPENSAPPAPQVEIITVTAQTVQDEPEFIGQTEAFRPVEIRAQVSGIIKKVFFTEGRNVKKGDQLYLIEIGRAHV